MYSGACLRQTIACLVFVAILAAACSTTASIGEAPAVSDAPANDEAPAVDEAPKVSELAQRIQALPIGSDARPIFPAAVHAGVTFDAPWKIAATENATPTQVEMGPIPAVASGEDLNDWCLFGVTENQPEPTHFARRVWDQRTDDDLFLTMWLWTGTYALPEEAENVRERSELRSEHCNDITITRTYSGGIPKRKTVSTLYQTPSGLDVRFTDELGRERDEGYALLSINAGDSITYVRLSGIPDDRVEDFLPLMDETATQLVTVLEQLAPQS